MIGFSWPRYAPIRGRGVAAFEVEDPRGGQYAYRERTPEEMAALFASRDAPTGAYRSTPCNGGYVGWPARATYAAAMDHVILMIDTAFYRDMPATLRLDVPGRHLFVLIRAAAEAEPPADPLWLLLHAPWYKTRRMRRAERRGALRMPPEARQLHSCCGGRARTAWGAELKAKLGR